jgi:hypothetical protein
MPPRKGNRPGKKPNTPAYYGKKAKKSSLDGVEVRPIVPKKKPTPKKKLPDLPPPLPIDGILKDRLFQGIPGFDPEPPKPRPPRPKLRPGEPYTAQPKAKPTMDSIRKKAILDLFVTPLTVGSTTIGITMLLLSWAFGGGAVMTFLGFLGVLVGLGWAGTNFALNLEKVVQNAAKTIELETKEATKQKLDELDEKLCRDRDPRDQTYLRDMRELYDAFMADYEAGKLSEYCTPQTVDQIKELFNLVVKKLEDAFNIWETSRNLRGKAKDLAQADRDKIIEDVGKAVDHMGEIVSGIRSLRAKANNSDMDRLRENLDRQLNAARRTQEQMEGINQSLHERQ